MPNKKLRPMRANGGYLIHAVEASGRAKCGHKPANNNFIMSRRGYWVASPGEPFTCPRCLKKIKGGSDDA